MSVGVLTPTSVGHYTVGVGNTGTSSYSGGLPAELAKYNGVQDTSVPSSVNYDSPVAHKLASSIARESGYDPSDYGDYIRQALDVAANNTAQSQAFAREQMDYQTKSNQIAMNWSAQEAAKNRAWQERLSNSAHQREVADLIEAGLNPILSANNGAYTGSGATGQAFSSSGAQGSVDTTVSGILGSLANAMINTASQASIARLYTDAQRYSADMSYAASKLASDTSIYNNHSNINANRIITEMNNQADINKANISANATLGAAGTAAAASKYGATLNYLANTYGSDKHLEGTKYSADTSSDIAKQNNYYNSENTRYTADKHLEGVKYQANSNWYNNPIGYANQQSSDLTNDVDLMNGLANIVGFFEDFGRKDGGGHRDIIVE